MANTPLTPVIHIDESRCVNCHMCISVCPVKICIDGSSLAETSTEMNTIAAISRENVQKINAD